MRKKDEEYINSLTDKEIVDAILKRDSLITRLYFYEKCFPLFLSKFNKYHTDCENCLEFINEIYVYVMTPRKNEECYLAGFKFACRLEHWLKIVTENYCHQLFNKKKDIVVEIPEDGDRLDGVNVTINIDCLDKSDVEIILNMMSNERYRELIRYRYLQQKTNEETAALLDMTMDNYYNKHKLAKEQFTKVLEKEGLL